MLLGVLLILYKAIVLGLDVFLLCNYDAYIFGALPTLIII